MIIDFIAKFDISDFIACFALLVAIITIFITIVLNRSSQKNIDKYKHIGSTNFIETNPELFNGYLKTFGITEKQLEADNLTINQLMYFCAAMNVRWTARNRFKDFSKKAKRVKLLIKLYGYDKVLMKAERNKHCDKFIINDRCTFGKLLRKEDFQKAWKYIADIWCDDSSIKLMVEFTIKQQRQVQRRTTGN